MPQKVAALAYVKQLAPDLPSKRIRLVDNVELNTAYSRGFDYLQIGSDVLPGVNAGLGSSSANSRISISLYGSLAHELVGHREAAIADRTQSVTALEEAQASIRAARFAPGLKITERITLLRDGVNRLRSKGIRVRDVKTALHIQVR